MPSSIILLVPTTNSPARVTRLWKLSESVRGSMMTLAGASTVVPVSADYSDFVCAPIGPIGLSSGHYTWRAEVSDDLDVGKSWNLGLFLAHALKAHDRLQEQQNDPSDNPQTVWATGVVNVNDLRILPVGHVETKLRQALVAIPVPDLFLLPPDNLGDVPAELRLDLKARGTRIITPSTMAEALETLELPPEWARSLEEVETDPREVATSQDTVDTSQDGAKTSEHLESTPTNLSLRADQSHEIQTATSSRPHTIYATPYGLDLFRRIPWPENLLMQIGVDRSNLVAVVSGIDGAELLEALSSVERTVAETDSLGCFGKRSWSLFELSTANVPKEKAAEGLVWKVPKDLTISHLSEVMRSCWPSMLSSKQDGLASAGNVLVAVVEDDRQATIKPLLDSLRDLVSDLRINVDVCGWSIEQAHDLIRAAADQTVTTPPKTPESISKFEWKLLQLCHSTQDVFRRSEAIHRLSCEYPEMSAKWRQLCDWIRDPKSYEDFLKRVDLDVFQIALLAGLIANHNTTPNEELAAAVVRATRQNPDLSSIILSLPVCVPVLKELMESEPKYRATIGLVTAEEMGRAVKPWVGNPVDQWRNGRALGF